MQKIKNGILPVMFIAAVSAAAMLICKIKISSFSFDLIGAPVISIIFGMIISALLPSLKSNKNFSSAVKFTSKKILQWAVIILGFTLNLSTVAKVGAKSLPVIICTIMSSLIVSFLVMKIIKINSKTACLIGVGSSICGGSAIAATAPVIDADDESVAQSISVIFLFNILAALIFPTIGHSLGFGTEGFAVFAGTAVNDTSSVTAAASTAESIYNASGILSYAVTVKLTRTLAIIPITLCLALYRTKKAKSDKQKGGAFSLKKIFPWFILYFAAASVITSIVSLSGQNAFSSFYTAEFVPFAKLAAKFFIAMAMCAIGLNTNIKELIKKGGKPILLGGCCWVVISLVSVAVQYLTGILFTNI